MADGLRWMDPETGEEIEVSTDPEDIDKVRIIPGPGYAWPPREEPDRDG